MIINGIPKEVISCINREGVRQKKIEDILATYSQEERDMLFRIKHIEDELKDIYKKKVKIAWCWGIAVVFVCAMLNPIFAAPAIYIGFVTAPFFTNNFYKEEKKALENELNTISQKTSHLVNVHKEYNLSR